MKLSEISIRRPVFTAMLALSLVVLGGLGLSRLGTELFPDVSFPFVTITTVYPGAGPADVEQQVTRPIEDAVAGIDGVEELKSISRDSVSWVFLKFRLSASIDGVTQEARDRVASVRRDLPDEVEEPKVARFDIRAQPVLVYSVSGQAPVERVRQVIEDRVKPVLEQIEGMALVRVEGGRERELRVLLAQEKLDALNLPVAMVFEALKRENVNIPSGYLRRGPLEVGVRIDAQVRSAEQLRQMVVYRAPVVGTPVLLSDVAEVIDGYEEQRVLVRTNGREAVSLEVVKQSGANTLALARKAKTALERLLPTLPDGIDATLLIDGSEVIAENAREVEWAIVFGGAMAVLVILFFLLDVRGTLISALALPTAVIGTFALMYGLGYSLNMMTLMGMSLAIGLLIDDSVVVREAITRRLEAGDEPFLAARRGTAEVGLAVLATSLTICAVFVPVAFMRGMVGQFFKQFGLTVVAAVMLSTFIALTLDPMLSARLSTARRPGQRRFLAFAWLEARFAGMERGYRRLLEVALRQRLATIALAIAAVAGAGWLVLRLGFEFLPNEDRAQFIVNLEFPPGTSLEETSARSILAERALLQHPEVVAVNATVGSSNEVRRVRLRVKTTPKLQRKATLDRIKDDVRPLLARLPQVTFAISDLPFIEGIGDFPPIIMQVTGPEMETLQRHAAKMAEVMATIPGLVDIDVMSSPGLPEISVEIDRDRAREQGLTASDIALQSRLALQGELAGKLFTGGDDDVGIRVSLSEDYRHDPEALAKLRVYGPAGPVLLGDVARLRERSGPAEIERDNRQRRIAIHAFTEGRPLGKIVDELHRKLDRIDWGPGYSLRYQGMQEEMAESNADFALALALSLLFIYMVLASQFESLAHPLTIVLSLPLSFIGAFCALAFAGRAVGLSANIGLILLMGLSAKNGILLVDGAIQRMRAQRISPEAAMLQAGPRRLRPILMTSAAMALGMLPTALARGAGAEFRAPMALAVVGGVLSNTLLTLVVVPVIYVGMERAGRAVRRVVGKVAPTTLEPDAARLGASAQGAGGADGEGPRA